MADGEHVLHEQKVRRHAGPGAGAELYRRVDVVALEIDGPSTGRDMYGNVRMQGLKSAQARHQPTDREGRGDMDVQFRRDLVARQGPAGQVDLAEGVAQLLGQALTLEGQAPRAAFDLEQADAEPVLQVLDLMADRRGRHAQLVRRPRQGAEAGRDLEGAQRVEGRNGMRHGGDFLKSFGCRLSILMHMWLHVDLLLFI